MFACKIGHIYVDQIVTKLQQLFRQNDGWTVNGHQTSAMSKHLIKANIDISLFRLILHAQLIRLPTMTQLLHS